MSSQITSPIRRPKRTNNSSLVRTWQRMVTAAKPKPLQAAIISGIIACLLGALIYMWIISPQAQLNDQRRIEIANLRQRNETDRQVEKTKPAFLAEFKRAYENYLVVRELLPEAVEVSNVLGAVQEIATRTGVRLTRFSGSSTTPVKSATADKLNERTVPSQVIGPHVSVVRFLNEVSRYERILDVRGLSITALKGQGESADFTLATYFAPDPSELPPVPAEIRDNTTTPTPAAAPVSP